MAIILPSRKFVGSETSNDFPSFHYIKNDVRQVIFNKDNNNKGTHLYFLPAYKKDEEGNGVWYHSFRLRTDFGDKFKLRYVSHPDDPARHFESNFRKHFSEEAKAKEVYSDKFGRTVKQYPNYGRLTTRVVYNVLYCDKPELGAHVLDLPSYNGASLIREWLDTKDARGRDRPMLNDPSRTIPVFVKLDRESKAGTPWMIQPEPTDPVELDESLLRADTLYNLEEIFETRTNEEIINMLRENFDSEVFNLCMAGYTDPQTGKVYERTTDGPSYRAPAARTNVSLRKPMAQEVDDEEDDIPMEPQPVVRKIGAGLNIPKATTNTVPAVSKVTAVGEGRVDVEETEETENPMLAQARDFLNRK